MGNTCLWSTRDRQSLQSIGCLHQELHLSRQPEAPVGAQNDRTVRDVDCRRRLFVPTDRHKELQVEARCWCGERALLSARTVGGAIQRKDEQVVGVGDGGTSPTRCCAGGITARGVTVATADRAPVEGPREERRRIQSVEQRPGAPVLLGRD